MLKLPNDEKSDGRSRVVDLGAGVGNQTRQVSGVKHLKNREILMILGEFNNELGYSIGISNY